MVDKKKKYKDPEIEVVEFDNKDIITLSLDNGDMNDNEEVFTNN